MNETGSPPSVSHTTGEFLAVTGALQPHIHFSTYFIETIAIIQTSPNCSPILIIDLALLRLKPRWIDAICGLMDAGLGSIDCTATYATPRKEAAGTKGFHFSTSDFEFRRASLSGSHFASLWTCALPRACAILWGFQVDTRSGSGRDQARSVAGIRPSHN
jgi:hypothetical protein